MATANDSQGLKIAVAIFVSLTVILAVTAYFLYSEYDDAARGLEKAQQDLRQKDQEVNQANTDFIRLRDRAGYQQYSDANTIVQKVNEDQQALLETLNASVVEASSTIEQAQQEGATSDEVEAYQTTLQSLVQRFGNETNQNPTFKGSLQTLAEMTVNQAELSTQLASDNVRLRRQLENVNTVNENELTKQEQAAQQANDTLQQEHQQYEQLFNEQRIRISDLSSDLASLQAEKDRLEQNLRTQEADYEDQLASMRETLNYYRTQAEKGEVVLDNADGYITFVDYTNNRVRTNITRSMGARPQMILAVFDADAPGLPSDDPKARIKLLEVTERGSVASIEEQFNQSNPLRRGDQVYSAAWSPTDPQRFALIGKIDLDRDGRDDRDDLKRLIRASGGVVEYDLPPSNIGPEQGELTARSTWYVIDERDPIRSPGNEQDVEELTEAREQFAQTRTEVIEKARSLGVRPLPIDRLLSSLGYSHGMLIPGQVEASDPRAIRELLNPEGMSAPVPGSEEFERGREEGEQNAPASPF